MTNEEHKYYNCQLLLDWCLYVIYILKQNCAKCRGFKSSRSSLWLTLMAGLDVIGLEDFIDICGCAAEANYHTVTD